MSFGPSRGSIGPVGRSSPGGSLPAGQASEKEAEQQEHGGGRMARLVGPGEEKGVSFRLLIMHACVRDEQITTTHLLSLSLSSLEFVALVMSDERKLGNALLADRVSKTVTFSRACRRAVEQAGFTKFAPGVTCMLPRKPLERYLRAHQSKLVTSALLKMRITTATLVL